MQKQNFEKQVQEKMEELSFVPSTPVWIKVEEQIRKKKERRRVLFWLFPLLLTGAGYGGWFLLHKESFIAPDKIQKTVSLLQQDTTTHFADQENKKEDFHASRKEKREEPETVQKQKIDSYKLSSMERTTAFQSLAVTNKRDQQASSNRLLLNEDLGKIKEAETEETTSSLVTNFSDEVGSTAGLPNNNPDVSEKLVGAIDLLHAEKAKTLAVFFDSSSKFEEVPFPALASSKKKWHWSLQLHYGQANTSAGIFNELLAKSNDMAYVGPPSNNSGMDRILSLSPSEVKPGRSMAIGVDVRRKVKGWLSVTAGLQYNYSTTNISVGQKVEWDAPASPNYSGRLAFNMDEKSGRGVFYRNNSREVNYENKYHFIQLPVGLEFRPLKEYPFYVHTGFKAGYLLSSNALHYNPYARIYYQDNSLLNKEYLGLFLNTAYTFINTKKFSLTAGPQLEYGLKSIHRNAMVTSQHLYTIGINTQITLKK